MWVSERRVNRRRDRHPVGQVQVRRDLQRRGTDDRLGVGAGQHTQLSDKAGQLALVAHLEQQMLRSPGACGQHHVGGGEGALLAAQPAAGARGADLPHPVGALLETGHRRHRNDFARQRIPRGPGSSSAACSWRRSDSRSCSSRIPGSRCAPARRRRSTGRAPSRRASWCRRDRRTLRPGLARTCHRNPCRRRPP